MSILRPIHFSSLALIVLCSLTSWAAYDGLGLASVDPELVKKYAPSAIPSDLSRVIQAHMDVRSPGAGIVSEDGKSMYFTWSVTGQVQIWKLEGPNQFPVQLTGGQDRTVPVGLTRDGKKLFVMRDRSGEENPGLYMMSTQGGPLEVIQHVPKVQTNLEYIYPDGKSILFKSNDQAADRYTIYRYDLSSKSKTVVWDQPGLWSVADVRENDEMLFMRAKGSFQTEFSVLDMKSGIVTPLIGQDEEVEFDVSFAPKKGEYFVRTNKFGDFRRLYHFAKGDFKPITEDVPMDVDDFSQDKNRKRLLVSLNDQGYTKLKGYDSRTLKPIKLPKFEAAEHVYSGSTTSNSRYTTFVVETAKKPRTNYVYDWINGRLVAWQKPSHPEIDTTTFVSAKTEHYIARDGTRIPMLVRRPESCLDKICPVIVSFHGGPEAQSRPGFAPLMEVYLKRNFVVVEPNVRGSDGYGKRWLNSDNGPERLKVITDIEDCAIYLRKTWAKDNQAMKIGVMGGSYGGYSTLMAMSKFAGAYDAGVAIVGMSDLRSFLKNTAPYRRVLRINEYGDPERDAKALAELSPITYVDKIRSPLMIIQGLNDPRVPAGEAIQIHRALEKRGIEAGLILFPDEGHGAGKRENRVLETGHSILFFEKFLR